MTIYDLTEALKRHRVFLIVSFTLLIVIVFAATFTIKDGSLTWRASPSYEATIKIAVIEPDATSLTRTETGSADLESAAAVYAALIETDEAAIAIGTASGFELDDPIDATVDQQAPVISATVVGPTPEAAIEGAKNVFTWLADKLQEPLVTGQLTPPTTTQPPLVDLTTEFESSMSIEFESGPSAVTDTLFLEVDNSRDNPTTLPYTGSAGTVYTTKATLGPTVSLVFTLLSDSNDTLDTVRVAAASPPEIATVEPILVIQIDNTAVQRASDEDGEPTWALDADDISTEWRQGVILPVETVEASNTGEVDIAVLTAEFGVASVGGRRGPITLVAALLVGTLLILSIVIVAETWRRARDQSDPGTRTPAEPT